jgi:hypothetical protein
MMSSSQYPNLLNNDDSDPRQLQQQQQQQQQQQHAYTNSNGSRNDGRRESTLQQDEYESESDDPNGKKRKRPMSVSCELCKQRKVKCDRGQPTCGWCSRNNQACEYRERKKPGLRAGYGRELESRLGEFRSLSFHVLARVCDLLPGYLHVVLQSDTMTIALLVFRSLEENTGHDFRTILCRPAFMSMISLWRCLLSCY